MRSPQQPLYTIFGVTFLLAGCDQGAGTASQTSAGSQGPAGSQAAGGSQSSAASQAAAEVNKCQDWLKVVVDNDPHFELEEKFRISGPDQYGDYFLRPHGSGHQATAKDHPLVKSGPSGDKFDGEIEIKGQGHGQPDLHFYEIVAVLDGNECPTKLTLKTEQHAGDPVLGVHGGDAVMD